MAMTPKERRHDGLYYWPDPKECPVCKKPFYPAPLHGWLIGWDSQQIPVCSYHCMREWEKTHKFYNKPR